MKFNHEIVEKNIGLLAIFTVIAISFGSLVEITPLIFQKDTTEPVEGLKPYTALQLEGRDIYVREGCYNCHSQMIRPLRAETERYGHYSVAGSLFGITHSNGVLSVLVQTWPVLAVATAINGMKFT